MNDQKYNGWTNYATWRANLEIFDGVAWLDQFDNGIDLYDAAEILNGYAVDLIIESSEPGLARDYALAFLQEVDWREIAQHMIADYADETETEEEN